MTTKVFELEIMGFNNFINVFEIKTSDCLEIGQEKEKEFVRTLWNTNSEVERFLKVSSYKNFEYPADSEVGSCLGVQKIDEF